MSSQPSYSRLYYDILLHILSFRSGDNSTLCQCALVNREFNRAASSVLYARVKLSPPPFKHVLDLKDRGELPVSWVGPYIRCTR
jgi:F-box-like